MATNNGWLFLSQPRIFILLRRCLFDSDDEVKSLDVLSIHYFYSIFYYFIMLGYFFFYAMAIKYITSS